MPDLTVPQISPSGNVNVDYGANQAFTVTPNLGYHVADVLVDGISQGPITEYTFNNVTANHAIAAALADLSTLLVGHWPMNEGSGTTLIDSSGLGNAGTTVGNPTWVSGVRSQALLLNGSSQNATVPDNATLNLTSGITLAAWIRPAGTTTQNIIKKAVTTGTTVNGYELSLASAGSFANQRPFVRFNQASNGDTYRLNAFRQYPADGNTWIHVAATYDGSTMRIYYNGILDSSKAATFTIATNSLQLGLGAESDGQYRFNGAMDDARVYNYALSAGRNSGFNPAPYHCQLRF